MIKKHLCLLILCLPLILIAQDASNSLSTDSGIKWTTGLSWEQVKQKAKVENKYIFIDAYTTWCKPCKEMDKYVYQNNSVGNFFNEKFISIKVQMDITEKDNPNVKSWYGDASAIKTDYIVEAYPSLIFLSPDAKIIQKETGYRTVDKLIVIARESLIPGKVYDDPYKEYKTLVNEYKQGIKYYNRLPYMIKISIKLNDADLAKELYKDHIDYTSRLKVDERYTKQSIEAWASFSLGLQSKALQFFLEDGDKIDQVMNQKGYARDVVDGTIQARIVDSFYKMQKGETTISTGKKVSNSEVMFMRIPLRQDGKIEPDYVEANWKLLKKMIRKNFDKDYGKRNVLTARIRWYQQHQNTTEALKMYFIQLGKYPPINFEFGTIVKINSFAWQAFLYQNDKKILKKAAKWIEILIQHRPDESVLLDTYANLLYKIGRVDEAIQWEEKALNATNPTNEDQRNGFKVIIEKMKKGEPTYVEEGAIWIN